MYWIILALFSVVEFWLDLLVSWIPMYYELKVGFLLWLQMPAFRGAEYLYVTYVEPYFAKHEETLDDLTSKASTLVRDSAARASKLAVDHGKDYLNKRLSQQVADQVDAVIDSAVSSQKERDSPTSGFERLGEEGSKVQETL
jgi:receptor expression-enhancing protein 1/2/3/4